MKKPLAQRVHVFGDGQTESVQRDLSSAFLVSCCEGDTVNVCQVRAAWPAAEPLLRRAALMDVQPASGRGFAQGFALPHVREGVRVGRASKRDGQMGEAADAYPDATRARAAENLSNGSPRTPRLLAVGRFS